MNNQQRTNGEIQENYRARIKAQALVVKRQLRGSLVHVSKPLILVPNPAGPQLAITSAPGTTLHINGVKQILRWQRRKDRVISPRQQRKAMKARSAQARFDLMAEELREIQIGLDDYDARHPTHNEVFA